jgi:hypothetical protein
LRRSKRGSSCEVKHINVSSVPGQEQKNRSKRRIRVSSLHER